MGGPLGHGSLRHARAEVGALHVARALVGMTECSAVLRTALGRLHELYPGALFAFFEEIREGGYCRATTTYVGDEILSRALVPLFGADSRLLNNRELVSPVLGQPKVSCRVDAIGLCIWELPGGASPPAAVGAELTEIVANAWRAAAEFEDLRARTSTDDLTGVFNRKAILETLHREEARAERYSRPLSVLFIDMDNFKAINDHHGHTVGDAALVRVAQLIGSILRQTDAVGRFGGDEFLVVLPDTRLRAARRVARRIEDIVRADILQVGDQRVRTSVTIGASTLDEGSRKQQDGSGERIDIVDLADRRMLANKRCARRSKPLSANSDTPLLPAAPGQ